MSKVRTTPGGGETHLRDLQGAGIMDEIKELNSLLISACETPRSSSYAPHKYPTIFSRLWSSPLISVRRRSLKYAINGRMRWKAELLNDTFRDSRSVFPLLMSDLLANWNKRKRRGVSGHRLEVTGGLLFRPSRLLDDSIYGTKQTTTKNNRVVGLPLPPQKLIHFPWHGIWQA